MNKTNQAFHAAAEKEGFKPEGFCMAKGNCQTMVGKLAEQQAHSHANAAGLPR